MHAGHDQPIDVGDVGHHISVDLGGDLGKLVVLEDSRIRSAADPDHARPVLAGDVANLVVVEHAGLDARAVRDLEIVSAGEVHSPAVRQVPAQGNRDSHDLVAEMGQRPVNGLIGRRAGIGLHVGVLGAEQRFGPLDRQALDLVHHLVAFIVSGAGIPLAVLVGQDRPACLQHGEGSEILGRNHLQRGGFRLDLLLDQGVDFGIGPLQVRVAFTAIRHEW